MIWIAASCNQEQEQKQKQEKDKVFPTVSYLDIKLDKNGHLPNNPYILKFKHGKKEIVFCGVEHLSDNSDVSNLMYSKLEQACYAFKPNVCVNEGGDISKKNYSSKLDALLKDGEIGLTKIMADSLTIRTVNGDPDVAFEFKELLKTYSKGEFLAYIVTERFMWSLVGSTVTDEREIQKMYALFIENYIVKQGKVHLNENEKKFSFYTENYEKLVGRKCDIMNLKPTNPFDPKGKFQAIGRKSKNIRDQYLLKTIDRLLDKNDKVFVVFGGWHLLTCQPGLEEIIKRKRS